MVQVNWIRVDSRGLPSFMADRGLIGTVAGKSFKIEAWSGTIQGRVGNGQLGGLMVVLEMQ